VRLNTDGGYTPPHWGGSGREGASWSQIHDLEEWRRSGGRGGLSSHALHWLNPISILTFPAPPRPAVIFGPVKPS
jgi:hypothetical protein